MEDMVDTEAMEVMVVDTVADMEVMVDTEAMVADTEVMVVVVMVADMEAVVVVDTEVMVGMVDTEVVVVVDTEVMVDMVDTEDMVTIFIHYFSLELTTRTGATHLICILEIVINLSKRGHVCFCFVTYNPFVY